jgi:sugar phosphate permease
MYMGMATTGYATSFFMPTILVEFGWSAQSAQVHTIPLYVVACACMLAASFASDRIRQRYVFILLGTLILTIGYAMLLNEASLNREAKYAALFLVMMGCYIAQPIPLAWIPNNMSGHWKRAFASGMQLTIGSCSGLIGSNIFLTTESPKYPTGYGVALGMFWFGNLCAAAMYLWMRRENQLRDQGKRDDRLSAPKEELENMGDYHPSFRFIL